jgi:hypothetical protein
MDRNVERFLDLASIKEVYLDHFEYKLLTGSQIHFICFSTEVELKLFFDGKLVVKTYFYVSDEIDIQEKEFNAETVTLTELLDWIKEVAK